MRPPDVMNADVRTVQLLLPTERRIGDERLGFLAAKVFVVIRTLRAEQVWRARAIDEIVARGAQKLIISVCHFSAVLLSRASYFGAFSTTFALTL